MQLKSGRPVEKGKTVIVKHGRYDFFKVAVSKFRCDFIKLAEHLLAGIIGGFYKFTGIYSVFRHNGTDPVNLQLIGSVITRNSAAYFYKLIYCVFSVLFLIVSPELRVYLAVGIRKSHIKVSVAL